MLEIVGKNDHRLLSQLQVALFLLISFFWNTFGDTLPRYEIEIDPIHLAEMAADPYSDEEYPAVFHYDTSSLECRFRYRGASSRMLDKKSFRVEFDNNDNVLGVEKLNLNAEYRDISLMRNYLAMKLYTYMDMPAPCTRYVCLVINGDYRGVYLQVENIDEDFLERYGRRPTVMYKAENPGANMAPLVFREDYPTTWEKKIGKQDDYTDLVTLFNKLYFWSDSEFTDSVENEFDLDAFLKYYAILFVIANVDGFSKNQFLNYNPDENCWELFPWDMDASFGNDYNGDYQTGFETARKFDPLTYHLLFQRCIENVRWEEMFTEALNEIITVGFDSLIAAIDTVYSGIKEDVYRDSTKNGTDSTFDAAVEQIREFLTKRKEALETFTTFGRIALSEPVQYEPEVTGVGVSVDLNIRSDSAQLIFLVYSDNVDFEKRSGGAYFRRLKLYDDGNHHDGAAGDLVYGNTLQLIGTLPPVMPYAFEGVNGTLPANGLYYIDYVPTRTPIMTFADSGDTSITASDSLRFDNVYQVNGKYVITLANTAPSTMNISCMEIVSSDNRTAHYTFPPLTFLYAGVPLAIGNDSLLMATRFPDYRRMNGLSIILHVDDTLRLLTPDGHIIDEKVIDSLYGIVVDSSEIVINEINYNSAGTHDTEDWVELYNPSDSAVSMTGWYFSDSDDNHRFVLPESTVIEARGYLVLCRDTAMFREFFPSVPVMGNWGFGLDGSGELVRLFDYADNIIDSFTYADDGEWPVEPDGTGPTLELISPLLENSVATNWKTSRFIGGSPGNENSPVAVAEVTGALTESQFAVRCGNVGNTVMISCSLPVEGHVVFRVVGLDGKVISTIANGVLRAGIHTFSLSNDRTGNGVCLLQMIVNGQQRNVRKLILVR